MREKSEFEILSHIIRSRRAIFPVQYDKKEISQDFIDQLLELANWAPTHRRTEPWRYVVVSGEARTRLGDFLAEKYREVTAEEKYSTHKFKKIKDKCEQSQYVLLVCMQRDKEERVPEWEEIAALAMSVHNMWLGCASQGVGCYWSTPALLSHVDDFVQLNDGERCMGLFYIGSFSKSWPVGERKPMVDKVRYLTA